MWRIFSQISRVGTWKSHHKHMFIFQTSKLAGSHVSWRGKAYITYIFILYIYIYINPSVENCQDLATWEVVAHAEALRFACLQNLGRPRAATELRQRTTQRSFVKLKSWRNVEDFSVQLKIKGCGTWTMNSFCGSWQDTYTPYQVFLSYSRVERCIPVKEVNRQIYNLKKSCSNIYPPGN